MRTASSAELIKMIALTGTVQEDASFGKNGPGDAEVQAVMRRLWEPGAVPRAAPH